MRRAALTSLVCSLLALPTAAAAAGQRDEALVFAAASLSNALQEVGTAFERAGGGRVAFNFAASSTLARQIEQGAPADVFISADEAKMDALERRGALVGGTRRRLLSNQLVVVLPEDSRLQIGGPRDLAAPAVHVLALAETRSVPAGIYAREYLAAAGVWEALAARIVPTENVRAALAAVESGNADAAIVYKTDAAISSRVKLAYAVPIADAPRISYPVAVLEHGRARDSALRFVAFLESTSAADVFRRFGFVIPEATPAP